MAYRTEEWGRRQRLSTEERALGLAFTHALRSDWDLDEAARHVAAVAPERAIGIALVKVRHTSARRRSEVGERAEQVLLRALELHGSPVTAAS